MATSLASIAKKLRKLGDAVDDIADDSATFINKRMVKDIVASKSPTGEKWIPTKKGQKPLKNAASALKVSAIGSTIVIRVTGPEALHSRGNARGGIVRKIVPEEPTDGMLDDIEKAFDNAIKDIF